MLETISGDDPIAAAQLASLPTMRTLDHAEALRSDTLSDDPPVRMIRRLLLPAECRYLIAAAEPELERSFIVHPETGRRIQHPTRTSLGMSFGPTQEDLVVRAINRRIAAVTGTDIAWGEPLQMLCYAPGQEYRPHVDALPGEANQRHWTMLVYLNEGYAGGETRFERLGFAAKGGPGDALLFRNVTPDGRGNPRTQHAGLPVTEGVKWLATRWIRQGPYAPAS